MRSFWFETDRGWVNRKHVIRAWVFKSGVDEFRLAFHVVEIVEPVQSVRKFSSQTAADAVLFRMLFDREDDRSHREMRAVS